MNKLSIDEKASAVGMLCEGSSIRSVERITGIHRDTVMRLGVRIGEGCRRIMDEKLRNLDSRLIEVDEVWGFIGMKKKTAHRKDIRGAVGDVWTWVALDAETKLVPTFAVGARSQYMANTFMEDLASRLSHRVQISSDALANTTMQSSAPLAHKWTTAQLSKRSARATLRNSADIPRQK